MRSHLARFAALIVLGFALARPSIAAPNYDRRSEIPVNPSAVAGARARAGLPALRAIARISQLDDRFGQPTFLWANRLDRPAGALAARTGTPPSIAQAAGAQLARLAAFYGLDRADLSAMTPVRVHDTGRGGIIATYAQSIGGVEVYGERLNLLLDRDRQLIAASGFVTSRNAAPVGALRLDAAQAARRGLEDFAGSGAASVRGAGSRDGGYDAFEAISGAVLSEPIRVKRVLFHLPDRFEPAYTVELMGEKDATGYVISAVDGAILVRTDQTADASFSYRTWSDPTTPFMPLDGPQGSGPTPHPTGTPSFYNPPLTSPILVSLQNGPIPTNDPWLPPSATETVGNNVDAYADLVSPDGFSAGDLRATLTGPNAFDRVYDTSQMPGASTNQRMAAIAQLFYTTNFLHDWYYAAGFDEAAGDAQTDNFGRGGVAGDNLRAEAQDYGGTNNANMSTPSDGGRPRMQMYLFAFGNAFSLTVNTPAEIAGSKPVGSAQFGPQAFSLTGTAVLAQDGVAPAGDACSAITNSIAGKIAVIDRGTCSFTVKVQAAQDAGAIAAIIVNNVAGPPAGMSGSSGTITIPSLMVSQADGNAIKAQIANGVSITMTGVAQLVRDGSIDNQVVAHEYGHYVSNRLIANSSGLGNNQGGGMGEGWGDFQAMLLTVRPEDATVSPFDFSGTFGLGAYALSQSAVASNNYYFGIRRYPYSTDMSKNPLTFQDIQEGTPLPAGPPINANGNSNAEVHNTGEVWCSMLWECYAALLRDTGRLTFAQAQEHMRDELIAAYKLTPANPTMTEARDAVLAAAYANDPADHALFCAAFAKRGCGTGAVSPPRFSTDQVGVTESYACGGALEFVSAAITDDVASCDNDGIIDNGERGSVAVSLRNVGSTTLSATTVTVTSSNPDVQFPFGHVLDMPATAPFGTASASLTVGLSGAAAIEALDFSCAIADPGLLTAASPGATFVFGNADLVPSVSDDFQFANPAWVFTGVPSIPSNAWSRTPDGTNFGLFAPDVSGVSDQFAITPPLQVAGAGNFTFSFNEQHSFETSGGVFYDGGVIEITTNGGTTWTDIGGSATPGYGGVIFTGANNPLSGRSAYVQTNAAWPAANAVTVNLGTAYAGQTVQVRFRLGTDEAATDFGWRIDDLAFTNLVNQPFRQGISDPDACTPVAVGDALPMEFALTPVGANPGPRIGALRFALPTPSHVTIGVYDVAGRRIAMLANGDFEAGLHVTTALATRVPGGVYFVRMEAGTKRLVRRLVILQ